MIDVGIVGVGTYLPEKTMKAAEIAGLTNGVWSEDAVINKLGIKQRYLPGPDDGTQEMGAKAALKCLENTGVDPKEIDVILCIGEEWKEYPLTTSACYIQDRIGATNAWGIDVQNRCCTCVSAMKIAADMLRADDEINTIMICGGYRNGDFVDFTDKDMSMMYNLSAGGGAIILKKNYGKNLLLGSKIMSDGSLARTAGVEIGGIAHPFTKDNIEEGYKSLRLLEPQKMKDRLNEVSMPNWYHCIDESLRQAGMTRKDIGYLDVLFCQAFFNRFLVFFSVFLKNIKKRAKSQANGGRTSRICGDFTAEYRKKSIQKHRRPFGRGCVRPMLPLPAVG